MVAMKKGKHPDEGEMKTKTKISPFHKHKITSADSIATPGAEASASTILTKFARNDLTCQGWFLDSQITFNSMFKKVQRFPPMTSLNINYDLLIGQRLR